MAGRTANSKKLTTLASLTGRRVRQDVPKHVHHFQLASIELERSRRERERAGAIERVAQLEERLAELEELVRQHQRALGIGNDDKDDGGQSAPTRGTPLEKRRTLRY